MRSEFDIQQSSFLAASATNAANLIPPGSSMDINQPTLIRQKFHLTVKAYAGEFEASKHFQSLHMHVEDGLGEKLSKYWGTLGRIHGDLG